jgi:hypothetical protein
MVGRGEGLSGLEANDVCLGTEKLRVRIPSEAFLNSNSGIFLASGLWIQHHCLSQTMEKKSRFHVKVAQV